MGSLLVALCCLAHLGSSGVRAQEDELAAAPAAVEGLAPTTAGNGEWPFLTPPPEPPDGVWLVDEQGEYFIEKYPRIEGKYSWQDEEKTIVRLRNLPAVPVWKYDDEFFYIRVNRVTAPPPAESKGPTEAELLAVASTYPGELPAKDRYRFVPFSEGLPERGQWRNGFAIADMNGDGHLDIVHPPPRKAGGSPVIFLGDGAGRWRTWAAAAFPPFPYDYGDAAVADFDMDGHRDIALAVHLRGLVVLRGDGKGRFELWNAGLPWAAVSGRTERHFLSRALAVVDWNGDGRPDLAALSEGPTSADQLGSGVDPQRGKRVFLSEDSGWRMLTVPTDEAGMGDHIRAVDLNRDGRMDLISDSRNRGERKLLSLQNEAGSWEAFDLDGLRPDVIVWAIEAADLNHDGMPDLVVSYEGRELGVDRIGIDLFYGDGAGRGFRRVGIFSIEGPFSIEERRAIRALAVGDLNGDGHVDVVGLDSRGETQVFFGQGEERFRSELSPELDPGPEHRYCTGYRARIVDLEGDGRGELVVGFAGEPGSEALLAHAPRCTAQGALRAFRLEPMEAGAPGS